MRRVAIAAALLSLSLAVGRQAAQADDAAEARFFDDLGRRAYARGRWEEALAAFLDAHAAAPSPRTLYNVALSAQLAHHDALAFSSFEAYLEGAEGDDPHRLRDARERRDVIAGGLALVHLTSEPDGAEIWVDRRELGSFGHTPRTLVLEPGAHAIELTLPDHDTVRLEATAVRAHRDALHATLAPHVGTLHVDVTPAEATLVLVRGTEQRPITAGEDVAVEVGAWTLRASAPGHVERTLDLSVARDHVETRRVTLVPSPTPTGRLLVSTGGVRARLSLDGTVRTETPARLDGVEIGAHHVALEADGFVIWEGDLEVREGRATHLGVTLVPVR